MIIARTVSWAARSALGICWLAASSLSSAQTIHQGSVLSSTVIQPSSYQPGVVYAPASVQVIPQTITIDLASAIQRGRTSLQAARLPDPKAAKTRLIAEMESFERYLGGPQSTNAQAWLKFLKWKELVTEVSKSEPNLRTLTDVELRYQQNILGLEYTPFQRMRQAIAAYIDAERFGGNPDGTIKALDQQLEKLLKVVDRTSESSELERSREIGQMAEFLASSNQAPELLASFRSAYSMPNVRVSVGEGFVNRAIGRPVNQPNPVDECVLGTRVLGNSIINGSVFADLVPQYNGISLQVTLSGTFASNNIGYNRGVKVYTTGSSPVYASKRIIVTP